MWYVGKDILLLEWFVWLIVKKVNRGMNLENLNLCFMIFLLKNGILKEK